ncbi:MAG TPA: hypothetical protein VF190_01495, partial [Rhodothermales bacterium]
MGLDIRGIGGAAGGLSGDMDRLPSGALSLLKRNPPALPMKKLSAAERDALLETLQARFEK